MLAKKVEEQVDNQALQGKIDELTDNWKRALADYQNLQKRYEREKADFVQFANSNLILRLVTILNHLEKAAESLNDKGLDLVVGEFKRLLDEEGLKEVKSVGEEFSPNFMEAVEMVAGGKEGTVAEVVTKGYLLKDKILLPAKVKVFGKETPEEKVHKKYI